MYISVWKCLRDVIWTCWGGGGSFPRPQGSVFPTRPPLFSFFYLKNDVNLYYVFIYIFIYINWQIVIFSNIQKNAWNSMKYQMMWIILPLYWWQFVESSSPPIKAVVNPTAIWKYQRKSKVNEARVLKHKTKFPTFINYNSLSFENDQPRVMSVCMLW